MSAVKPLRLLITAASVIHTRISLISVESLLKQLPQFIAWHELYIAIIIYFMAYYILI